MKPFLLLACVLIVSNLMSIEVIHNHGLKAEYSYEYFRDLPRTTVGAELEKKGQILSYTWKGFRFDHWLQDKGYEHFTGIRFESPDRYMVTLTRYEFEQNECWMVFEQNGESLDINTFRVIFPALRQMYWIAGMSRIVLEDFVPLKLPQKFLFMDKAITKLKLVQEPKPFVKIQGYYFDDIYKSISTQDSVHVIMQSGDGLKIRLQYPHHLAGAVLELTDNGTYNLKSPQIPGGMWLNDIVYLQINEVAFIREKALSQLVEISKSLSWHLQPPFQVLLNTNKKQVPTPMTDLLSGKALTKDSSGFVIIQD
jgi:hypothetical protein